MLDLRVESVADFLRAILPTEAHFPGGGSWYFRGQGNAAWGLVPSMRRAGAWKDIGGAEQLGLKVKNGLVTSPEEQLKAQEERILKILTQAIDRLGLPSDLKQEDVLRSFAQHLGLPTRLLDFTRSPMIGAYFAAADAVQLPSTDRLVVFAVSPAYLQHSQRLKHVERLRVPGYGNPNLVAQQGVFLKVEGEPFDLLEGLERVPIEAGAPVPEALASNVEHHLLAITLPWSCAPKLVRTLRDQGVHAGTVYPGQRGIAELVREVLRTEPA